MELGNNRDKVYVADFETTTGAYSTDFSTIYVWGMKPYIEQEDNKNGFIYDISMRSFLDSIIDNKITIVYFHNLSFDGNFILKWMQCNDILFTSVPSYEMVDNEWSALWDESGTIYTLSVKYRGRTLTFKCSYTLLVSSVEALGKYYGSQKLELDYHKYKPVKSKENLDRVLIEYLERDIDIIIKSLRATGTIYKPKLTSAGTAYANFQEHYGKWKFACDFGGRFWNYNTRTFEWNDVLTLEEWEIAKDSFQGGYSYWKNGMDNKVIKMKKGYSVDKISLYSSIMLKCKMPYGSPLYTIPKNISYIALIVVFIRKGVKKKKKWPNMFKDRNTGNKYIHSHYMDSIYYEERVYWSEEWDFINKYYNIDYYIVKTMYFKTKYVFSTWIKEKMDLKNNAPNPTLKFFHKTILNALFGKFGQNHIFPSRVLKKVILKEYKFRKNQTRYGKRGEYIHTVQIEDSNEYKYMPIASYICSMARLELWKGIIPNIKNWIYSDTDSMYLTKKPKKIKIGDANFGDWKPEHTFNKFKVIRSKCYMYRSTGEYNVLKGSQIIGKNIYFVDESKDTVKISGISKNGRSKINWYNFNKGLVIEKGKTSKMNVRGGYIIVDTDFKIKDKDGE